MNAKMYNTCFFLNQIKIFHKKEIIFSRLLRVRVEISYLKKKCKTNNISKTIWFRFQFCRKFVHKSRLEKGMGDRYYFYWLALNSAKEIRKNTNTIFACHTSVYTLCRILLWYFCVRTVYYTKMYSFFSQYIILQIYF